MKKYELVFFDKGISNVNYYRVKALRDFGNVKAGDIGGIVSGEHNLSHDGNCWIFNNSEIINETKGNKEVEE